MDSLDRIEENFNNKKSEYDSLPEGIEKDSVKRELDNIYIDYSIKSFKYNNPISDETL